MSTHSDVDPTIRQHSSFLFTSLPDIQKLNVTWETNNPALGSCLWLGSPPHPAALHWVVKVQIDQIKSYGVNVDIFIREYLSKNSHEKTLPYIIKGYIHSSWCRVEALKWGHHQVLLCVQCYGERLKSEQRVGIPWQVTQPHSTLRRPRSRRATTPSYATLRALSPRASPCCWAHAGRIVAS